MSVSVGSTLKTHTTGDPVPMAAQPLAELSPIHRTAPAGDRDQRIVQIRILQTIVPAAVAAVIVAGDP
jgi:hypothetical protein